MMRTGLPERHGRHDRASRITTKPRTPPLQGTYQQLHKLKKDVNPMKILSQISAVEVKFKQSLSKEKKVKVVQGCVGDNYA
jgi:hypothetical protein